jgi:hypothetical protein
MEKAMSDASDQRGWAHALGGLLGIVIGGVAIGVQLARG